MAKVKDIVFGAVIFLLTLFVGIYGINTFYGKSSNYDDYCPMYLGNETSCIEKGGNWVPTNGESIAPKPVEVRAGYCDYDYTSCQQNFEKGQEKYWRGTFLIALPIGIIIILIGALIFGLEFVGAGLMLGGLGILIYGVGGFWRFAQDWLKFSLSLVGLVILIYFAYWYNRKHGKRK
jgi:hypothetical protein